MKWLGFLICGALGCAVGVVPPRGRALGDAGVVHDGTVDVAWPTDSPFVDAGVDPQDARPGAMDAGEDSWASDTGPSRLDGGVSDGGASDGGTGARDAGMDAFVSLDAGPEDGPLEVPSGQFVVASAEYVAGIGANRLGISELFSVGWRFEVPAGSTYQVSSFGFHNRGGSGTVFGSIVELSGSDAIPEVGAVDAVLPPTLVEVESTPGHVVIPANVELGPGWYAMVFGTDAYGAHASGEIAAGLWHDGIPGVQTAISISRVRGTVHVHRAGARFFLIVAE